MQKVSAEYKKAMQQPLRNRGYIQARIGIVSSTAQDNVMANDADNTFAYFANNTLPFEDNTVTQLYATLEQDFSKVDGTMYFLPPEDEGYSYYNQGMVTADFSESVKITFDGNVADIKGLTIYFGECYPTSFTVTSDNGTVTYSNAAEEFVTEDTFDAITYLIITPLVMVNGDGRMRIYQFTCGISNTFSNKNVKSFTYKDYVSSICESLPSQDMTLTVDNQDLYYNPDNPASAVAYMEQGQTMKVRFGYDVDGLGTIEWVKDIITYLKSWSATDTEAKFTMVDVLDWKMTGTYYKGVYHADGITLYDLAIDVLTDAGIEADEYIVDPYLKDVTVYNPVPAVKHSEALQIISNAGRCVLSTDRDGKIKIQSSFVPDMSIEALNDETETTTAVYPSASAYPSASLYPVDASTIEVHVVDFGNVENVLTDSKKPAYTILSADFDLLSDSDLYFLPRNSEDYKTDIGWISKAIADADGNFTKNPTLRITLEASWVCYGLKVAFRNAAPQEYHIITYYQGEQVQDFTVTDPQLDELTVEEFDRFDMVDVVFTKGYPNARITVDSVILGDATDYTLSRDYNLTNSPTATRQERIKAILVERDTYRESTEEIKDLTSEETMLAAGETELTLYMNNASYGYSVVIEEGDATAEVVDSSCYFVKVKFTATAETALRYTIKGYEYVIDEQYYRGEHNDTGTEKTWSNPLVSTVEHAKDLEEWLATYYLGDVEYSISWNGDPRTDANDLFYLELKDRDDTTIRAYQNELKFSGAWSGTLKARKAVL